MPVNTGRKEVVKNGGVDPGRRKSVVCREPSPYDGNDVIPFPGRELMALAGDAVPFLETLPATGRRRVLGDERRMVPHRGLPAVVRNVGRGQALVYERAGVVEDGIEAFASEVFELLRAETKTRTERGPPEPLEETVEILHRNIINHAREAHGLRRDDDLYRVLGLTVHELVSARRVGQRQVVRYNGRRVDLPAFD